MYALGVLEAQKRDPPNQLGIRKEFLEERDNVLNLKKLRVQVKYVHLFQSGRRKAELKF